MMLPLPPSPLIWLAQRLRRLWLRMLTGLVVRHSPTQVHERICALPILDQGVLVGASVAGLALASALFAQAGPGGPVALWGALLWVCR